ncbi:MAG TPA: sugar phosphate isomerase/epimerase family protein [Bryobacteraceae bacterium]|jgi:sugar phosphate isomerase/epimerase|nr:sugar phosphate isomerase/epimerase family protein [Bryobacteraceae bacterium]
MTRRDVLKTSLAAASGLKLGAASMANTDGFKLGIITDELTEELNEAAEFISSYGLHYCELREMWGKNIMNSPQADLDRARKVISDHRLQVSDIGSPIFKWNLPKMPAHANEKRDEFKASFIESDADRLLEQSFRLARFFGTPKVRIFSYWRVEDPEKAYPMVAERLRKAAQLASRNDIILVLENEMSCNVGTGKELGRILRDINSPHLRGNWDPGNAVMLGETPYPDGYHAVRGLFPHMHVKDVRKNAKTGKLEWAPVGGGIIDFRGQFAALKQDRYEGTMSLETHYRRADGNKVESTRESLEGLLKVI